MRIKCPLCGARGLDEFIYHGDATVSRPDPDADGAAEAFHDYAYIRTNPAGDHSELWFHNAGCHSWLVVKRNTRTHEIHQVDLARDVAQERQRSAAEKSE